MAKEEGIVTELGAGATAWVKTTRSSACKACSAANTCRTVGDHRVVEAENRAQAQVGDHIVLDFQSAALLKATFLIYLLPILCLLVGAALGQILGLNLGLNPSVSSAIVGGGFFVAALGYMKLTADRMARKSAYKPKITRIIGRMDAPAPD